MSDGLRVFTNHTDTVVAASNGRGFLCSTEW